MTMRSALIGQGAGLQNGLMGRSLLGRSTLPQSRVLWGSKGRKERYQLHVKALRHVSGHDKVGAGTVKVNEKGIVVRPSFLLPLNFDISLLLNYQFETLGWLACRWTPSPLSKKSWQPTGER